MPQFPEEDRWSRHAQAQVQSTSGEGTATRRTTGNTQEKPLPAMPRESGEFWLDESMDTRSIDDGGAYYYSLFILFVWVWRWLEHARLIGGF